MTHRMRALAVSGLLAALPAMSHAYTAAGDRTFPATLILPQVAPSDEFYLTPTTQPLNPSARLTGIGVNYVKTITERLAIGVGGEYSWFDQMGAPTAYGWQNFTTSLQYLAIQDADHEFLLSVGGEREFGGTGAAGVGANALGATTPNLYVAKGMGDVPAPYLRPFAVAAVLGFTKSDGNPRADTYNGSFAIEYSIPYLESKVRAVPLPDFVRALTPIVEFAFSSPSGSTFGTKTTGLVAPGVTYAGEGWEFGIEGQIPTTRATGRGVGIIAQLHLSLDYFFPETLGRPLFGGP